MIDVQGMTVIDSVQDLQENTLCQVIVTDVAASFGDVGKEVAVGTILDNDKGAVGRVDDLDE